jgi:hypothetical protein
MLLANLFMLALHSIFFVALFHTPSQSFENAENAPAVGLCCSPGESLQPTPRSATQCFDGEANHRGWHGKGQMAKARGV